MTVAEPLEAPEASDAARSMLPGMARDAEEIAVEVQLLLGLTLARLQRVVTHPGSGDRKFLRENRGRDPAKLSEAQRKHIIRLAWRYRFQMPALLRPGADPDKINQETAA